jgi:hypothetical protein
MSYDGLKRKRKTAMKNYTTYVQKTELLCATAQNRKDTKRTTRDLMHMQKKIMHSDLTVYQKEFLMRKLGSIEEAAYA